MQINIIATTVENESMNLFECQIWLCKWKQCIAKGLWMEWKQADRLSYTSTPSERNKAHTRLERQEKCKHQVYHLEVSRRTVVFFGASIKFYHSAQSLALSLSLARSRSLIKLKQRDCSLLSTVWNVFNFRDFPYVPSLRCTVLCAHCVCVCENM